MLKTGKMEEARAGEKPKEVGNSSNQTTMNSLLGISDN